LTGIAGMCAPSFVGVRDALAANLRSGEELGASLFVSVGGNTVVDLWGGYADAARQRPWVADTIVNVWSITKIATAIVVLRLARRGMLQLDASVGEYWPEFAAHGKADITVRQILSHSSGVSGWDPPFATENMYDLNRATSALAAQAPWWKPGSASGYHAQNQGHLLGEIVRRVSGLSLRELVASEVAGPTNADFQLGGRREDWSRIAEIIPPPRTPRDGPPLDRASVAYRTFTGPMIDAAVANTPGWRGAELGALNGHGNARSVGAILGLMTDAEAFDEQVSGTDLVLGVPVRFGLGVALSPSAHLDYLPSGRVGFWGGWGGSLAIIDLERDVIFAYVMNKMAPGILGSARSESYVRAVYSALART
jgi:CubicO group peptidase (beta-lactamase class C family)